MTTPHSSRVATLADVMLAIDAPQKKTRILYRSGSYEMVGCGDRI